MFDNLVWQKDRLLLGDLVFRLQHYVSDNWDLVIDDAAHVYGQTKRSFECLFPTLAPGGLYIIEDWAWEHWKECASPIRDGTARGDAVLAEPARFRLEDHIYRRADPTRFEQLYGALRRVAGRRLRALQRTLQSTRARP
jgi:hypothetical protein